MNSDTTDWEQQDTWCPAVEALFADRPPVTWDLEDDPDLFIAGFPNPASYSTVLGFYRSDTSYVDVRIVDAGYQLVFTQDSFINAAFPFSLEDHARPGELLRVYYRVVHADGTAHRGHGDIKRAE